MNGLSHLNGKQTNAVLSYGFHLIEDVQKNLVTERSRSDIILIPNVVSTSLNDLILLSGHPRTLDLISF